MIFSTSQTRSPSDDGDDLSSVGQQLDGMKIYLFFNIELFMFQSLILKEYS